MKDKAHERKNPFPGIFLRVNVWQTDMLCREYLDQKQSAEVFDEVAGLVKEDVELPTLELADDPVQEPEELTAFEKYADVYAQNSDLVGWISIPDTRIDYPVMQTKDRRGLSHIRYCRKPCFGR